MIHVEYITSFRGEVEAIDIRVSATSIEEFKELVHRAVNLWPDATPKLKNFADQIIQPELIPVGKEGLQDYYNQK